MGIANLNHKITHSMAATGHTGLTLETITNILSILPRGTRLVSMKELPITGLWLGYDIALEHELFKDGAEVLLTYNRHLGFTEGGELKEYKTCTGFNRDDVIRQKKDLV